MAPNLKFKIICRSTPDVPDWHYYVVLIAGRNEYDGTRPYKTYWAARRAGFRVCNVMVEED